MLEMGHLLRKGLKRVHVSYLSILLPHQFTETEGHGRNAQGRNLGENERQNQIAREGHAGDGGGENHDNRDQHAKKQGPCVPQVAGIGYSSRHTQPCDQGQKPRDAKERAHHDSCCHVLLSRRPHGMRVRILSSRNV